MEKIRIWDKHPGSATLLIKLMQLYNEGKTENKNNCRLPVSSVQKGERMGFSVGITYS
jgi:hypothetical protein